MSKIVCCELAFNEAIEAIRIAPKVMYKHGVWNPYYMRNTDEVIKSIERSGYGASVYFDTDKMMFYVSIPSDGDMF